MPIHTAFWGLLLTGVSTALCFVPLFDLLAYEFSFAMSAAVALAAGATGVRIVKRTRAKGTLHARRRAWVVEGLWLRATDRSLRLALLPLVPITINVVRVTNCDYLEGLAFYGLLAGVAAVVGAGWGVLAALTVRRGAFALYVFGVLATVVVGAARVWFQPPVDVFNPFVGYFPGSIYDEVIPIGERLIWSRIADVGLVAVAIAVARPLYTPRDVRIHLGPHWPGALLFRTWPRFAVALAALIGAGFAWPALDALGLYRDTGYVRAALGGLTRTTHFEIYHPRDWAREDVDRLGRDLEFRHAQLTDFFGRAPSASIGVYYYPDTATKKRLMGAARTRIAKPWQRAVHLQRPALGDSVVAHELAHVFSAEIADSPHRLSLARNWLPNMGLIEGLAVAATWESGRLDPHQWSAAMRQLDIAPDVERLMDPSGFLATHSRTAYTTCGSLVRYLRDRHGVATMAQVYRDGHFDRQQTPDLDALALEWRAMLDRTPIDEGSLAMARVRFDRPAIFGRRCAHEIAARLEASDRAARAGDLDTAIRELDAVLGFVPNHRRAQMRRVRLLYAAERFAEARVGASALATDEGAGIARRARAAEWLADLDVVERGEAGLETARAHYREVLDFAFDRGQARRLAVKLDALGEGEPGRNVLEMLTGRRASDAPPLVEAFEAILAASPSWPVARYLHARQAIFAGQGEVGRRGLRAAVRAGLPHPALAVESHRLIARSLFDEGRYDEASAAYSALAERDGLGLSRGERSGLATWAERAAFFATRPGRRD